MALGMRTTYTDTTAQQRVLRDLIEMIDPTEVPLLKLLGTNNEGRFNMMNWPNIRYEWLEDTLSPDADTLGADIGSTGATSITVTTAVFQPGHVIKIDSEYLWVYAVNGTTLTVTRGFYGSTAATHSNAATIDIITVARLEGDESDPGHTTDLENPYNYSQILHKELSVSGTEAVISQYGIPDRMAYDLQKILGGGNGKGGKGQAGELPIRLVNTAYYGKRTLGNGTSIPRTMGGFDEFITNNVTDASAAALSRKLIEDAVQTAWAGGGKPDTIICHGWAKRKITSFYEGAVRTERSEKVGGAVITTVTTEFGDIDVVLDRRCPPASLWILDTNRVGWVTVRPWDIHDLAKTGDSHKKEVVGELGFVCMNNDAHAKIHNFSITK